MGSTHPVIDDEAEQKLAEKLEERNLSPKVHSRGKLVCWQLSLNKQQARWMEELEELSLDIKYKEGPLNVLADMLSHQP